MSTRHLQIANGTEELPVLTTRVFDRCPKRVASRQAWSLYISCHGTNGRKQRPFPAGSPPALALRIAAPFDGFAMRSASPRGYGALPSHAAAPAPSSAPSAVHRGAALVSSVREQGRALIATQRPWGQLLDSAALGRPSSAGEAISRLRRNLTYFRSNYALFVLLALAIGLIWQPAALAAALILAAAWFFLYLARDGPLVLFDRRFDEGTVLGALSLATFLALVSTDLGSNVFKSVGVGLLLVGMHAVFRITDDLFMDESEAVSGGLVAGLG
ncbi:hypothetical protein BHE74_00023643, partial [Ensete ventricosum]